MDKVAQGKRFAKRIYYPRIIGTILCSPGIIESIWSQESRLALAVLFLNVAIWPHLALYISRNSLNPYKTEMRNLSFDSIFCGLWICAIGLNPFPAICMSAMVLLNSISTGGIKALARGAMLQGISALSWALTIGIDYNQGSIISVWVSMPLLTVYPWIVGLASYKFASELNKIKNTLNNLSITDSLTGLLNRRYLDEKLQNITLDPSSRIKTHLIAIDIDNFKKINDTYGHAVGDSILCLLGKTLRNSLRGSDLIARFGGDEFCIIIEGIPTEQAHNTMERIRLDFISNSLKIIEHGASLSIGISPWHVEFQGAGDWLSHADMLLYRAKTDGRNTTISSVSNKNQKYSKHDNPT